MDKSKAIEILEGKTKTNHLKGQGQLIHEPEWVLTLIVDGTESLMSYGANELTQTDLDYLVHRDKGVTLGDKKEFYSLNKVVAKAFTIEGGSVVVNKYIADPVEGWSEKST